MARDIYEKTMALPDITGAVKALSGIRITVYKRDTNDLATIYQRHDGIQEGPAPDTGASGGPNPFVTGTSGAVEFWAEGPDEYDVLIEDTLAPARIATRRRGWNALPAADASYPTAMLATDADLGLGSLAPDVLRQMIPIGQVIDWWRPASSVPVPDGFEICDGHQVAAGQHEFPGIAVAVNMPDLRNVFILGADIGKTDATGAGTTDAAASAPGIRGSGGSQTHALTAAQTGIRNHTHSGTTGNNGFLDHYHTGTTGTENSSLSHKHVLTGWAPSSPVAWGQVTVNGPGGQVVPTSGWNNVGQNDVAFGGPPAHTHSFGTTGPSNGLIHTHPFTTGNPNGGEQAGSAHNNIPRFYGLLKIMKVRRA